MEFKNPRITALYNKYYDDSTHPYKVYNKVIMKYLKNDMVLLDAGCGATAPVMHEFINKADQLIGLDLTEFDINKVDNKISLMNADLNAIPIKSSTVDMVISRSVLEHVKDTEKTFKEISRVLKRGGHVVFLIPNLWDYVSLISKVIPNKIHPLIMAKAEGRCGEDTFPTYYKANTFRRLSRLADENNFKIIEFEYLSQFPSHFTFSSTLFHIATQYDKLINRYNFFRILRGWILIVLKKQ